MLTFSGGELQIMLISYFLIVISWISVIYIKRKGIDAKKSEASKEIFTIIIAMLGGALIGIVAGAAAFVSIPVFLALFVPIFLWQGLLYYCGKNFEIK